MARTTPEETFAEARAAMERGDWEGVFSCLDGDNLARIGENSIGRFLVGGERAIEDFAALCGEHGITPDTVAALRTGLHRMSESGRATIVNASDPTAMMQHSRQHQENVKAYRLALKATLKAAPNRPAFIAALERALGGGSISARLLVGEVVENVEIDGARAWGVRHGANGFREDVGFVRKKGLWYLRLFGQRPR